jgi:hypothetical protein
MNPTLWIIGVLSMNLIRRYAALLFANFITSSRIFSGNYETIQGLFFLPIGVSQAPSHPGASNWLHLVVMTDLPKHLTEMADLQ